ncbi:peroxiredoxin family protein [Tamlana sp. I1]|uniref:peroxiredoxin family protein n=1 Tax=Tamlana sp. I1 TaxID=2762061 RepID=UPI0018902AF8|nr:deiodinase-like protein [Tamlana sp. I1]
MSNYNYHSFKPSDYDFKNFKGPKAGEKYIDFKATTLEGKQVALSDYLNKPIVLDTGSITCPMYANTQKDMNALKAAYPNFHFLLLYVREAHPGAKTKPIKTMAEKLIHAKSTCELYPETRAILVDSLDGHAHLLYGGMPNMTYVIGTDGIVKFRANWTNIEALKKVLNNINKIEPKAYYPVVKPPLNIALRTLLIGGVRALFEFMVNLPKLLKQHKDAGSM